MASASYLTCYTILIDLHDSSDGKYPYIILTSLNQRLSTPMYFFLKHLSFLDSCFISVTVPKPNINSITHTRSISFLGLVPPTLNPMIYNLRNKRIKDALRKILLGKISLPFNYFM
ncbi:olfactory receptor 14A16-like [Trichechus inunguis]